MNLMLAVPDALAIGLSLGLLGSGGSILTVPVLVYLLGRDEKVAIAGSLFIVGSVAGSKLARRLPQDKLKNWFGRFLVVMGIYILARSGPAALRLAT
jgi:uncharacterized membrane protein YfcA